MFGCFVKKPKKMDITFFKMEMLLYSCEQKKKRKAFFILNGFHVLDKRKPL